MYNTSSKIIILGGGSAGWLTALFIKRNWPRCDVSLIEDPKRPPIIAGESGSTTHRTFLRHLQIDDDDFIKNVNATPKMGGKFTDWNGVGTEFIHAMQTDFAPWLDGWTDHIGSNPLDALTMRKLSDIMKQESAKNMYLKTLLGNNTPLWKAFFAGEFIRQQKVPFGGDLTSLPCIPMWHFESRDSAAYFKKTALSRGVNHIEGEFLSASQDERGNIVSLKLDGDREVTGDWFFDCSGFARLLLGKVLKEPLVDMTDTFPQREVIGWWDEPCYCVTTNATAMEYGWSWNINLKHRSGNGYIFDPDLISKEQAHQEAEKRFNKKIDVIANLKYQPGAMRNVWKNNVFAIGLSSGFVEPLEANGIALIVETLYAVQDYWDPLRKNTNPEVVQRMNDKIWFLTEDFADFIALHYHGNRNDTEFWRRFREEPHRTRDSLRVKLEEWEQFYKGLIAEPWPRAYSPVAWMMVIQGIDKFRVADSARVPENLLSSGEKVLNINLQRYKNLVDQCWSIEEWIQHTA